MNVRLAAPVRSMLAVAMAAILALPSAHAQTPSATAAASAPTGPTVRAEMGKPLQAAQALLVEKKYAEALAQIDQAGALPTLTPYEAYVVARMRAAVLLAAKDFTQGLEALEVALKSDQGTAPERLALMAAGADAAYNVRDYKRSAALAQQYLDNGGNHDSLRLALAQAHYLDGAFAPALQAMQSLVDRQRKAGSKPSEKQLRLMASAYDKLGNQAGYDQVLEMLIADHPAIAPWTERLIRLSRQPAFDDRLLVDVLRLGVHLRTWTDASPYVQLAERALAAGFAREALHAMDTGAAAGLVGKGADAALHQAVRQRIDKQLAVDAKAPQSTDDQSLAKRDGRYLFRTGYDLFTAGQRDRGLAVMDEGIKRGVGSEPLDARLRLASAYARSGQPEHLATARRLLTELETEAVSADGLRDLARLWMLQIGP